MRRETHFGHLQPVRIRGRPGLVTGPSSGTASAIRRRAAGADWSPGRPQDKEGLHLAIETG